MAFDIDLRSRLVLATGFLASAVVFSEALGPYLTWPDEPFSIRVMTLFMMPMAAAVIYGLIRSLRATRSAAARDSSESAIDAIVFCVMCFLIGVHLVLLAVLLQVEAVQPWAGRAVIVLLGATMSAIGNFLPRTRPNAAVGIRTSRTMDDRQLWVLTHRASGYVAVATGVVTMASGLLLDGMRIVALPTIAGAVGAGLVAGYYRHLAQRSARA